VGKNECRVTDSEGYVKAWREKQMVKKKPPLLGNRMLEIKTQEPKKDVAVPA